MHCYCNALSFLSSLLINYTLTRVFSMKMYDLLVRLCECFSSLWWTCNRKCASLLTVSHTHFNFVMSTWWILMNLHVFSRHCCTWPLSLVSSCSPHTSHTVNCALTGNENHPSLTELMWVLLNEKRNANGRSHPLDRYLLWLVAHTAHLVRVRNTCVASCDPRTRDHIKPFEYVSQTFKCHHKF